MVRDSLINYAGPLATAVLGLLAIPVLLELFSAASPVWQQGPGYRFYKLEPAGVGKTLQLD